jgi:hypothetical protein
MVGRVLRKCLGKPEGFVYDLANNYKEHGPVEAIEWPRAAKGLLLENDEREICAKSYAKRENVWTRCSNATCGHVYNVKTSKTCKICNTDHNIMVVTTISAMITNYFQMNQKQFEVMAPKIRLAIDNPMLHNMVNKQMGQEVFRDGALNLAFTFLPEVLAAYEMNKKRVGNKYVGNWDASFKQAA